MEVQLTADQVSQLDQLARATGKHNASELVKDFALHFLQAGLDQADRGDLIDESEMDARVERLLSR